MPPRSWAESGFLGVVSLAQLRKQMAEGHGNWTLAGILSGYDSSDPLTMENFPHVHVDQPLDAALKHIAQAGLNVLPVVSRTNLRDLRGVVCLNGILRAYGVADAEEEVPEPVHPATRRSGVFSPRLIAATLGALLLAGCLTYYSRSQRAALADRYFKAGNELVLHDRNQEAVEQFRSALSVSPNNREYRLALGLTLVKTDHLEEASVYLEELLRRDPINGRANLGLARIAAQQGRTADAVTCYHRAIYGSWPADQAANQVQARFELAGFLEKAGLRTQATAELLAMFEMLPPTIPLPRSASGGYCSITDRPDNRRTYSAAWCARTMAMPKPTPGWERPNLPRPGTSRRARPFAAPYV